MRGGPHVMICVKEFYCEDKADALAHRTVVSRQ